MSTALADPVAVAAAYAREALAEATRRAYAADWLHFTEWCQLAGRPPLPASPETVAAYLPSMAATHARATIRRRLQGIARAHRMKGLPFDARHPAIRDTLRGLLRRHGAPARKAAALTTAEVKRLVATCDGTAAGTRDRALLLLGFAGALRRAELAAVEREHVTFTAEGLRLLIPRAKGDAEGRGAEIGMPRGAKAETCPVRALERWLAVSGCRFGPVFRKVDRWGGIERQALRPEAVGTILKRRAAAAGLSATGLERLTAHGLRAGFITQAYQAGARDEEIMAHTRHRDLATMRGYVRRAKLVSESPVKKLGL